MEYLINFLLLIWIIVFIFLVNSIAMKKKAAANALMMLRALKLRQQELSPGGELEKIEQLLTNAERTYTAAAKKYNTAISTQPGKTLNIVLRYQTFPEEL